MDIANETKSDYVFVVLGHDSDQIMEELKLGRAQILLNKDYKKGLSGSIRAAISNLPDDCSYVVLMVADQPYLTPMLVDRLIESLLCETTATSILFESLGEAAGLGICASELTFLWHLFYILRKDALRLSECQCQKKSKDLLHRS